MKRVRCRALGEITRSETDGDDLIIFGRASAGNLDRKGTFIDQASLWEAAERMPPTTLFWSHDWNAPIGTVEELVRGKNELLARSRVGKDFEVPVSMGLSGTNWSVNNIRAMVEQGIVRGYSIGFDGYKKEAEDKNEPPTVFVTEFIELSICPIPANATTTFGFSRSMVLDGYEERPGGMVIKNNRITPGRFEFAPQVRNEEDEELEVLTFALENLKQAVAGWK